VVFFDWLGFWVLLCVLVGVYICMGVCVFVGCGGCVVCVWCVYV